ncbi:tRNA 2'-phosphotransferase [Exophiala dermatitidis]|uniref:2'-phosphotransferase n=1 Tax=Exophiala dermatitidis TaxID=5970 RepID=A0AAN6EUN1_EXODE|nr:tRNA 2'-phosphotransferase [Exophiala dermatitidis]KAJ4505208.1 tRNA 2'-phosphotransferase [Exophiala dermatitidis]KAJ4505667.1 tRNA 2'-phosphotransferase [Exophiala dermatitidis]KAJ4536408.1 tRNA 2'-phosphotransferase [Exophiala dermatitidis]KAJ4538667.1 tRNA 2'-phosphotransferase [Exophiala dermatitidis]
MSSNQRGGGAGGGGGRGGRGGSNQSGRHASHSQPRTVLVSKALSRLLRHAAVDEGVPIDKDGYVRMDHLFSWPRIRNMKPPVTMGEIIAVVQDNEKKRFALKYVPAGDSTNEDSAREAEAPTTTSTTSTTSTDAKSESESETQRAIAVYEATKNKDRTDQQNQDLLSKFFIRATQGHSMKLVEAENLLKQITLDDPSTIPDTVVHGTFYGAWQKILESGGLKRMGRNHIHFATGPALDQVLPLANAGDKDTTANLNPKPEQDEKDKESSNTNSENRNTSNSNSAIGSILTKNKVISGMRSDAQILIYVDIRKALTESPDMTWWRSENGVILTEGVEQQTSKKGSVAGPEPEQQQKQEQEDGHPPETSDLTTTGHDETKNSENTEKENPDNLDKQKQKQKQNQKQPGKEVDTGTIKLLPIEYWLAAVEIKNGLGLLWKQGQGVVRDLPDNLKNQALPFGKRRGEGNGKGKGSGGRGRGRGRGGGRG